MQESHDHEKNRSTSTSPETVDIKQQGKVFKRKQKSYAKAIIWPGKQRKANPKQGKRRGYTAEDLDIYQHAHNTQRLRLSSAEVGRTSLYRS